MSQLAAPTRTIRRTSDTPVRRVTPRVAPATAKARVRTVERATAPKSNGRFLVLMAVIAFGSILALLLLNTARAEQSFTLSRLNADVKTLEDRQEALSSEIDAVSAPEELAIRAEKLGMKHASGVVYKDATSHKVIGVAGSSAAGSDINVNTLPNTPASNAAAAMLDSGSVGLHITDPVAKAQAEARAKAKADAKKAQDKAKADAKKAEQKKAEAAKSSTKN